MTGSDLSVAVQEQTFVVCNPVKHLQQNIKGGEGRKRMNKSLICHDKNHRQCEKSVNT